MNEIYEYREQICNHHIPIGVDHLSAILQSYHILYLVDMYYLLKKQDVNTWMKDIESYSISSLYDGELVMRNEDL